MNYQNIVDRENEYGSCEVNFLNMVPALMYCQEKYNINPIYLIAHFIGESGRWV